MSARALIVAAPASGQGKTLVTAGLAKALLDSGKSLRVFKMGPDYLDPAFIEHATGLAVRQLDYWMQSREDIQRELQAASEAVDHIIIEGVMGLFDGEHSVARLAADFRIPVLVVADASAMAQTFGALMHGLSTYDPEVPVAAVLANKVGSARHGAMLAESIRPPLKFIGAIPRQPTLAVHERHLGIDGSRESAGPAAAAMAAQLVDVLGELPWQPLTLEKQPAIEGSRGRLAGLRIAVARDAAFSFLYHANLDFLQAQGASLGFFSPLGDAGLPDCDALYLPGGYPELHAGPLAANTAMKSAIHEHISAGKVCVAECGGMLYLQRQLNVGEDAHAMAGVFEHSATLQPRLAALGYQHLPDTSLRGHSFHYAKLDQDDTGPRSLYADGRSGERIFRHRKTVASFVHWYFSSDPATICKWFRGDE